MRGFEELKEAFNKETAPPQVGRIISLHLAEDRSFLKVQVELYPEQRQIVARMTWDAVGPEAGSFTFPQPDDLVLVVFANEDDDDAYVIKRLTSKVDKIPQRATENHTVLRALLGKWLWLTSDSKIYLSRGDDEPQENIVLGQIFKQFMIDLFDILDAWLEELTLETHVGNLGFVTSTPRNSLQYEQLRTELAALKASPIEDEEILSDVSFTEK